ncbi:unnamed protein product [Calypogeia fissa]
MEFSKFPISAVVLLKICSVLMFFSYASSETLAGCPLIAPLSSYSPSIPASASANWSLVTSEVSAELETRIASVILNNSIVPFYAVSVVHEDQTVFTSGSATSPFMIGSITKTFTAMGALMLRARGLLSLDDPVKKFLPDFSVINPFDQGPYDITLRDLMGQVSGLPLELCAVAIVNGLPDQLQCPVEEAEVLQFLAGMELVRPPWSREPSYSNLGFGVLGHAWEKATSPSKTWEQFVVEEILAPLGMSSSGVASDNVTLVTNDSSGIFHTGWLGPSANMYSTASDLAKYLIFLLKANPALLPAATIREWMHSSTIFPDGSGGYALPWELLTINSTSREFLITKDGEIGNFVSIVAIHPPTQLGVSVLLALNENSSISPNQVMEEVLDYLIPLVEEETTKIIDPFYTGHYVCTATPSINSQQLNVTVEVLGGFIDIVDSPSLGLMASINVSVLFEEQLTPQIETVGLLLKNSTENSFWLGDIGIGCSASFGLIGSNPSTNYPNFPGTDYGYEIEFNFANKTVLWPALGAVCVKT